MEFCWIIAKLADATVKPKNIKHKFLPFGVCVCVCVCFFVFFFSKENTEKVIHRADMHAVADIKKKMQFHVSRTLSCVWVTYLSTLSATLRFPDSIGRYLSHHETALMKCFVLEVFLVREVSPLSPPCDLNHHAKLSPQFYAMRLCLSIWTLTVKHIPLGCSCWEKRKLNFHLPHFLTPSWVLTGNRSIASVFLAPG